MKRTVFAVFDGLDFNYIKNNRDRLSFFDKLLSENKLKQLNSVIPADSIPSWTTIYTGLNPAEHGIIESIDYLDFKHKVKGDYSSIKGKAIFDKLSKKGKKVLVFNPFMAYPAWEVNGLMVSGPVFEGGEISVKGDTDFPYQNYPHMGGLVEHPTKKNIKRFFEETIELGDKQFETFIELFNEKQYDFAFLGLTTTDRLQHFTWRYSDVTDVTYKKKKDFIDPVYRVYKNAEDKVKYLFEQFPDDNIIIISDHGHGKRCEKTFYVNRWLIQNGFIPQKKFRKRCIEFLKNSTLKFLAGIGRVEEGTKFFKKFRFAHKVKNADYVFKKDARIYAPKFDGVNSYGGIRLNKELFASEEEYEATRSELIEGIKKLTDNGKHITEFALRREEIYSGENISVFPDVVYKLNYNYGVDRGLFGKKLFGINPMHQVLSGGHKAEGIMATSFNIDNDIESVLGIFDFVYKVAMDNV